MPKITDRERKILADYRDVMDDKTNGRNGWACPIELGHSVRGFKKLVLWGYLRIDGDGEKHTSYSDYQITPKGIDRLRT